MFDMMVDNTYIRGGQTVELGQFKSRYRSRSLKVKYITIFSR